MSQSVSVSLLLVLIRPLHCNTTYLSWLRPVIFLLLTVLIVSNTLTGKMVVISCLRCKSLLTVRLR